MRKYLDGPLAAFVIVMVAAASITSHGTYLFYSLILPWELAAAATIVLTAGIPLLELAAVLDKPGRPRYIAGMVVLLGMEALAQYYQGQASFVAKVQAQFPVAAGIDLATFAAKPEGRLLPILYLAILSGVVVYFGYAASVRIRELRGAAQLANEETQEIEQLSVWLEQSRLETEQSRAELEQQRALTEQFQSEATQAMSDGSAAVRSLNDLLSKAGAREHELQAELEHRRAADVKTMEAFKQDRLVNEDLRRELAQTQAALEQLSVIDKQDLVESYLRLRRTGQSERTAAQQMGFSVASLNAWVNEVAQVSSNGHREEVIG